MIANSVTAELARWIARRDDPPSPRARRAAQQALLDWTGVALAGADEPLVAHLIADAQSDGCRGHHPIIGHEMRVTAPQAARINGASSHALDFDDINKRMRGHPSVAIVPAILAGAQEHADADIVDAFVTGTEVACMLGEMMGEAHYARGFHATATIGTVAAAAGVCRVINADADTSGRALSLAATQASGLRAMFGTMAKPLHAGLAAERGLMAARWAARGMSAAADGIGDDVGFGPALSEDFAPLPIRPDMSASFGIEGNVFKYHAACYYTHSAIEAVAQLRRKFELRTADIDRVLIQLKPGLEGVCDIVEPTTGLEVKFSVRHLVAMVLAGRDTTDPTTFKDALAADGVLCALREKVDVAPLHTDNRMEAATRITLRDGTTHEQRLDVSAPASDLDEQETRLRQKFVRLAHPRLGNRARDVADQILAIESAGELTSLLSALAPET
ncbi:MmgE/PrpD family protein [uncultured Tateyamaria sp.]|uniref:MmgE/PrpD family protein n=1 Tax=uncultured Tateyamaria sp. TaxID=455651 RepID=UPI00260B81B4|nr:MmgE/PrpD family protein [uncultured Tateyamaria sp.]